MTRSATFLSSLDRRSPRSDRAAAAAGVATTAPPRVEGRLALFPVATKVVVAIDVAQLRGSPAAAKLAAEAQQDQADQHEMEEFARRTGFDPLRQLTASPSRFPRRRALHGELGVVLRAEHFDEARLVAYVRDQLQK